MINIKNKIIDKIHDEYSIKLFNKYTCQLTIAETAILYRYINDVLNPIWKEIIIDGNKTGYFVNNIGDVRDKNMKLLKKYNHTGKWYDQVYLSKYKNKLVHRLVAEAFIPNPNNLPHVNHINGIKTFNWVGNLEWVTPQENVDHAWKHGLINNDGENQGSAIYKNDQIHEVCKLLEKDIDYKTISTLTGVSCRTISSIMNRVTWKSISKNYKFPKHSKKYTDEQIHEVCRLLEDPKISQGKISEITNVSVNCIKDIMKKTSYRYISDKYDIKKRINKGQYNPVSKYTEEQIRKVCKMLEDPNISVSEISNATNVKIGVIYNIIRHRDWKNISKYYNIKR